MTLPAPSVGLFRARYPEFAPTSGDLITLLIGEALGSVDETWRPDDQVPAILALAAHALAMEGEPARSAQGQGGSSVTATPATTGPLRRIKVGNVETEFAGPATTSRSGSGSGSSAPANPLSLTAYGQRFLALRARNVVAVAVV